MAEFVLSDEAERDLDGIIHYTAVNFGEAQARSYAARLYDSARMAAEFPNVGRLYVTESGDHFRQYSCGRHALFYQPHADHILIVRILHLMMDFERNLSAGEG